MLVRMDCLPLERGAHKLGSDTQMECNFHLGSLAPLLHFFFGSCIKDTYNIMHMHVEITCYK